MTRETYEERGLSLGIEKGFVLLVYRHGSCYFCNHSNFYMNNGAILPLMGFLEVSIFMSF